MVKKVWILAAKHRWIPSAFSSTGCQDFLHCLNKMHSFHNPTLEQKFSLILWSIWKSRNTTVFNNETFSLVACIVRAKKANAEWRIRTCLSVNHFFRGPSSSPTTLLHLVRWNPLSPEFVKLNFDGSLINSSAAGDFIIRDWTGKLVKAEVHFYDNISIIVAEARALRDGLWLAIQVGFKQIAIEGDNKIVIQSLKGHIQIPWQILNIIKDIHLWQTQGIQLLITHIFREANTLQKRASLDTKLDTKFSFRFCIQFRNEI